MSRQTVFNSSWLSDKTFSMWLGKHPDSTKKARCLICSKAIELGNMGKQAMKSHADGAKHKLKIQLMQKTKMGQPSLPSLWGTTSTYREPGSQHQDPHIDKLVVPPPPQPEPGPSGTPSGATATTGSAHVQIQQNINSFVARDSVFTAEILWALKSVIDHYSASSSSNVSALFQRMFPDSAIAHKFAWRKTKCSYLIKFGLAPYFHSQMMDILSDPKCLFSISFDESFKKVLQQEQMDLIVRYLN